MYDVIIIGGGTAGMTAALYALRNGKSVLVLEKESFGGQITHSPKVENYPGTLQMSGNEFAKHLLDQILAQGAEIELENAISILDSTDVKTVQTEEGHVFEGKTVILANGVRHRMLGLEQEDAFIGEGISFCAVCDGDFYAGKQVCVAGGGNSALQEALLLSDKCSQVTLLQDLDFCTGEQRLQDVLFARPNVRLITGVRITGIDSADTGFNGLQILHTATDTTEHIACDGLFVAIGLIPDNKAFASVAALDNAGYYIADERCLSGTPGIFVAGDCRQKAVRQLTTAAADGATAALAACRYIDGI